ncbi:MAG: OmpA family protein [Pontiellaceae bacterium]|jgi:outer membrane protein OmpA-like peptidoglycan-associated protein|nr:OmpA family protein [Pontiellaceae bacterium]
MNWIKNIFFLTAVSLSLISTGCRSAKIPLTPAQQGAVVGGIGGGTVGALWAHNSNRNMGGLEGAGYGVVAGVAAGALLGDALDEYAGEKADNLQDKESLIDSLQRQLSAAEQELTRLRSQPGMENVQVESINGQLRFTILNEVLFDAGKADLKQSSKTTLDSVLAVIEKDFNDREICVEGHTDSDPIRKSAWKDNWELSYNRSIAVVNYFVNDKLIAPERLKAVACGEFHPVVPDDSAANKRLNRRAVIVVMPAKDSITIEKK